METIHGPSSNSKRPGLLKPAELVRIKDLFLVARGVVEGFVSGHHKSPYKGFSLEFAEHRKYVHGDEIKHIDWKVFGRTEKYFVKQYESETNMRVYIALDTSKSMEFQGGAGPSKLLYSTYLAAALVYLIGRQQDLVGLVTFDEEIGQFIPPRNSTSHMRNLMKILSELQCGGKTRTLESLKGLSEKLQRRCLIVVISDFLDNPEEIHRAIGQFRNRHHEVIALHVLDNSEIMFPYNTMTTFLDMEGEASLTVDPVALRSDYLKAVETFKRDLKSSFTKMNVDYVPVNTIMPFEYILSNYLEARRKRQ